MNGKGPTLLEFIVKCQSDARQRGAKLKPIQRQKYLDEVDGAAKFMRLCRLHLGDKHKIGQSSLTIIEIIEMMEEAMTTIVEGSGK